MEQANMKYILEVEFTMDDNADDESELIEQIRSDVQDSISEYSETYKPKVKIREIN